MVNAMKGETLRGRIIKSLIPPKEAPIDIPHLIRALNDETYDQHVLSGNNLRKIIGHLPKWITYPDADRVPWLNKGVRQMWPFLDKAISNSVVSSVEPLLNKLTAAAKIKLVFSKFTLGLEPPVLVSVKAVDEVPNEIGLDIEFKWAAADPEVQLDVSVLGVVLPIALERVTAFGCVRVVFGPLCDWWPTFSDMQVAFIGKPQINFNLRLIGGDITTVPFVENLLTNLIKNVLVNLMVWPNKLDINITEDQGAKRTSNSGILRITVRRASNLPNLKITKAGIKPVVEVKITDGEYDKPVVVRRTGVMIGAQPIYDETFEVRVHDIRGAQLNLTVIDTVDPTAEVLSQVKRGKDRLFKIRKKRPSLDSNATVSEDESSEDEGRGPSLQLKKSEKQRDAVDTIRKTTTSVLGCAEYEVGQLVDTPNQEVEEVLQLMGPKSVGGKIAVAGKKFTTGITGGYFKGRKKKSSEPVIPEVVISAEYLPFDNEAPNPDDDLSAKGMSLDDLLAKDHLDQFCGVLHLTLIRGDSLAVKDSNGRSDPYVKFTMGKQEYKSSTKYETLNPVWDEEYDFIVGQNELEQNQLLRCEVWDRDPYGYKEWMGVVGFDVKRIIGELLLLGGAGAVVKRVEELQETSSGRLHVQFEFFSVKENTDKVENLVQHIAEAEVDEISKQSSGRKSFQRASTFTKKEKSEERAKQLLTGLTQKGKDNLIRAAEQSSSEALSTHAEASAPEGAFDDFDEEDMPRGGGGCFGGCFGSSAKKHHARAVNGDMNKQWEVGANSLPAIESATPDVSPQRSSLHGVKGGRGGNRGANAEASSRGFGAVTSEQDMGNESESP